MKIAEFRGQTVPSWDLFFDDEGEIAAAADRWRVIVIAQHEAGLLDATSGAIIVRLVVNYALYDRVLRDVAERGAVLQPKRGSSRAISRVNPSFTTMTKLNREALEMEAHLGLTPRTRGSVTKAQHKARRSTAADEFLRVIPGGRTDLYPPPPRPPGKKNDPRK